jgi:3-methyladenine DNA glycosylase AlkD
VPAVSPPTPQHLLASVRRDLRAVAVPQRARPMQRYMRSEMPYHGVPAPAVHAISRRRFADLEFPSAAAWQRTVRYLWNNAQFREERYCAIALTRVRAVDRFQTLSALPLYEELIVSGAWWDYVDELAIHPVGDLLRKYPGPMGRSMRAWSRSEDLWKRRSSIICQVGSKDAVDRALLYECIEPSMESREFFLRKGIGWALRQYARNAPDEVARYVAEYEARLSPLSRREALRHVRPSGAG